MFIFLLTSRFLCGTIIVYEWDRIRVFWYVEARGGKIAALCRGGRKPEFPMG